MGAQTPSSADAVHTVEGTVSRYRVRLVKEDRTPYRAQPARRPDDAARLLHALVNGEYQEVMGALLLDTRNRAIGHCIAYRGTLDRTAVEPRGLLVPALLANAPAYIAFHNHPSGDPDPSQEDIAFTKRLVKASRIVGIKLLDHLVLGERPRYVSLRVRGFIRGAGSEYSF